MPRDPQNAALSAIVPVILAGGQGRRLWPLSTDARPKPFLKLASRQSLLQKTVSRVSALKAPYIVCNARHRALVMAQLGGQAKAGQIILEPQGRGSAPAVAAAAHFLSRTDDSLLLVLPSDHYIHEPDVLLQAVIQGVPLAREGWLVTFGVPPEGPSPHYGYIRAGAKLENRAMKVDAFVEKPDRQTARLYLREGSCFWNSGIFLFSARTYLESLKARQKEIYDMSFSALSRATRLQNSIFLEEKSFSACPALSIDYAVMEKTPKGAVIPVSMGWRDLGTWPSLLASLFGTGYITRS